MMTSIDDMLKEDEPIAKELNQAVGDHRKMIEVLGKRHKLYLRYEKSIAEPINKVAVMNMRSEVFLQIIIFKLKADLEEDIAKIFSRLDNLEAALQDRNPRQ